MKSLVDVAAFLSGTGDDWERQFQEQLEELAGFAESSAPASDSEAHR